MVRVPNSVYGVVLSVGVVSLASLSFLPFASASPPVSTDGLVISTPPPSFPPSFAPFLSSSKTKADRATYSGQERPSRLQAQDAGR